MSPSLRALATAGLAALIAAAVHFAPHPIWFVFPLLAVLVAAGWGQLLRLPDPMTINIIVGTAGFAFVLVAFLAPKYDAPGLLALAFAITMVLAFFSQMIRNPRPRLVEVVAGIATGAVVQLGLAAWVLAARAMWHTNPAELTPGNLGFRLVLPFALVLVGCGVAGTALFQNWPGNPDAGRPIWARRPAPVVTSTVDPGAIDSGMVYSSDVDPGVVYSNPVDASTLDSNPLYSSTFARPTALASWATAAAVVAVWGFAPFLLARLLGV